MKRKVHDVRSSYLFWKEIGSFSTWRLNESGKVSTEERAESPRDVYNEKKDTGERYTQQFMEFQGLKGMLCK